MVSVWFLLAALTTISLNTLNCSARNDEPHIIYKTATQVYSHQHVRTRCKGFFVFRRCHTTYYLGYAMASKAVPVITYRCKPGWIPNPTCHIPICRRGCRPGFKCTAPETCTDINECVLNQHRCQHVCVNTLGSFKCQCKAGYELNLDNKTCSDTSECADGTHQCQQECHNTVGGYSCSCKAGYRLASNGKSCNDINECLLAFPLNPCKYSCTNTIGSYTCGCDSGYQLKPDGSNCEEETVNNTTTTTTTKTGGHVTSIRKKSRLLQEIEHLQHDIEAQP